MKSHSILPWLLCGLLLLSGCTGPVRSTQATGSQEAPSFSSTMTEDALHSAAASAEVSSAKDASAMEPRQLEYPSRLFDGSVLEIDINTAPADWAYLLEHAQEKPWITADITVGSETFSGVGIKTKGNTSLTSVAASGGQRYSLKVNFGKFNDGQTCWGLDKLALNNIFADNTYMKEYMSYHLFRYMDVPAPLCAYCSVTVNGEPLGVYLAVEDTDDSFLARNYGADHHVEAYKPESMDFGGMPGGPQEGEFPEPPSDFEPPADFQFSADFQPPDGFPGFPGFPGGGFPGGPGMNDGGVSLRYTDDEPDSYANIFENGITRIKEKDKRRLINSLKGISQGEHLEQYIQVDEVLRYTACNVFLVNLDSYFSMMGHNYILVEDFGQLAMIPWDYNLSFGTHNISSAGESVNYPIDTVFSGVEPEARPIISKLLEQEEYRERYHGYLREICEDYIRSGVFDREIDRISALLDGLVANDGSSFGGYEAYQSGVPALRLFGQLRTESVLGQLAGTIPSEQALQADSSALVDASALDLGALGSMDIGPGGPPGP